LITEAKNNLLLMDNDGFAKPRPVQQTRKLLIEPSDDSSAEIKSTEEETHPVAACNFDVGGSVSENIGSLTVLTEKPMDDDEFESIVSPSQVRDHKKSIDEQFEKLLMDDNNNNAEILLPDVVQQPFSEVFIESAEIKRDEDT
jgi:hypothetical protein